MRDCKQPEREYRVCVLKEVKIEHNELVFLFILKKWHWIEIFELKGTSDAETFYILE